MATPTMGTKRKPLSISEKLNIISKVDGTPNAPCTKFHEELGIPVATLYTVMHNRNKILKQSLTEQLNRKKMGGPVAYDCPSVPTCSEAMEDLEKYEHFLRSNADVPEHIVQSLWNLKMYTANVFEKRARQTTLDKYFKQK
jgi:hypothetical protein